MEGRGAVHLAHARRRTRRDERDNASNHSLLAGDVVGTYNGTILNADTLFWRLRYPRQRRALCLGQMAAAFASPAAGPHLG